MTKPSLTMPTVARRGLLQSAGLGVVGACLPGGTAWAANPATMKLTSSLRDLTDAFNNPPPEARPGVFWYWMNGIVTQEGIAADLAAMAQAGFGRAILFSIGLGSEAPGMKRYASLTPEWWDLFAFAIEEAGRVGMEITVGACDGWATAAGPWITPELSMQRITFSQAWIAGARRFTGRLPQPFTAMDYYRDIRVVAFPLPAGWTNSLERKARVTTSWGLEAPQRLNTHAPTTAAIVDTDAPGWIEFAFDTPFTLRSVMATGPQGGAGNGLLVEASDDGHTFRRIGHLAQPDETTLAQRDRFAPGTAVPEPHYTIDGAPATTARVFRLHYAPAPADQKPPAPNFSGPDGIPVVFPAPARLAMSRLVLLDERTVPDLAARSARAWSLPPADLTAADLPAEACVPVADIVDLTSQVGVDGTLDWTPPRAGPWKIVRIGHTSNGAINGTGFPAGRGLECDKMNPAAARLQFDNWLGQLPKRVDKAHAGRALSTMHVDSWECGSQNWSPVFPGEFARRRGYDLLGLMPVMAGVPVDQPDTVNRVLADVRRTIADATGANFYGELARLGHAAGYDFSAEACNPIYPGDPLAIAKYADRPMGEFWIYGDDKPSDIADAIHGGHVYGRRVIGAEAFTEFAMQWNETPYSCKPLGDANWAKGVNQLTCHVWACQPWTDAAHEPGMTLGNIGVFFSRTNTWFAMAKPWFDYLRRGQAVLQQGRPVVDIACFLGEDIPVRAYVPSSTPLPVPPGYQFDSLNPDALLTMAQVRDGWIVLPGGQRYAVLVLPRVYRSTAAMLRRIARLVSDGATVIGAPPVGTLGLEGGVAGAKEVAALTAALWAPDARLHRHGAGQVGMVDDLSAILRAKGAAPDLVVVAPQPAADSLSPFMWTHRSGQDWDLYFISNQSDAAHLATLHLRASGTAELWDADTGQVSGVEQRPVSGGIEVLVPLAPCGSAFVVVRQQGSSPAHAIQHTGTDSVAVPGPWKAVFTRGLTAPRAVVYPSLQSWSHATDPDIRFYAGTATYETEFVAPAGSGVWQLDLGDVADVCEVDLNGQTIGRLWKPPYTIDLGHALRVGTNRLTVRVANTWHNRLVGDADKPQAERHSFTVTPFFSKKITLPFPPGPDPSVPTVDAHGLFLGGGYGNDAKDVPLKGSPAGTPPPKLKRASRYGFAGGGSSAPGPDVRRKVDEHELLPSGLLGPVRLIRLEVT